MLSEKDWIDAEERGRLHTLTRPCAIKARYEAVSGTIIVDMNRGFSLSFHKSRSQVTHAATDEQLAEIEVIAPDWYIFFPKLDDGLTVDGMLAGRFGTRTWEREWADCNDVRIAENTLLQEPADAVAA